MSCHVALYGKVAIQRSYCESCGGHALVIEGALACCGRKAEAPPARYKRMSEPVSGRSGPSADFKRLQIERQENRCVYCERSFGGVVTRVRAGVARLVDVKVQWDHFVPYSYIRQNGDCNFVAACQICNGLKKDRLFQTLEEAQIWIRQERSLKGYE